MRNINISEASNVWIYDFNLPYLCLQCLSYKNWAKDRNNMDRVKRIWYLSPMWAGKVQASLRIRAVSPEPPLLTHTSSESRGTFRQKARSLAPLNGWTCAVKICHDGMLEDTNSLDGAHMVHTSICLKGEWVLWVLPSICDTVFTRSSNLACFGNTGNAKLISIWGLERCKAMPVQILVAADDKKGWT